MLERLGPSLLVFGALLTCPAPLQYKPKQIDRFKALSTARREMEAYVAEQRICISPINKLPPAPKFALQPGQPVTVFQEEHRRWLVPYTIDRINDKIIHITDGKKTRPFNITQAIPGTATSQDADWQSTLNQLDKQNDNNFAYVFLVDVLKRNYPRFETPL